MRSWVFLLLFAASSLAGCGGCAGCGGVPARDGAFPYRACLLEKGERPRTLTLSGGGELAIEERSARFMAESLRIAAFRGAPDEALEEIAESVEEERVDLLVMIGSAGRERGAIRAQLEALLAIGPPLLIVPGGDDSLAELDRAIGSLDEGARERLLDARRLYTLRAGGQTVGLVPGSPEGRFAYDDGACGYNASDLRARRVDTELFIAWAASGGAIDEVERRRGVFAFPAPSGNAPELAGRFIVGPIAGDPYYAGGGYRAASPSLFRLSAEGFSFIGPIEPRADARMVPTSKP